jgi:hypothetical protein
MTRSFAFNGGASTVSAATGAETYRWLVNLELGFCRALTSGEPPRLFP